MFDTKNKKDEGQTMKKTMKIAIVIILVFCMMVSVSQTLWAASAYRIIYTGTGTLPPSQDFGTAGTYRISTAIPTKTGHTFSYWLGYDKRTYSPGEYVNLKGQLILSTVWEADTYRIQYRANGGANAPDTQIKTYNKSLKLSTIAPTRTGYTFQGWGTSSTTATISYKAGATYSSNSSITLYAVWVKSYAIKYMANGGVNAPSEQTKIHDKTLNLSNSKPTRAGYTFQGWGDYSSSSDVLYKAGAKYTDNASITLYAIWKKSESSKKDTKDTEEVHTAKKQLSTPKNLKLTKKRASWKKVKNNNGYTLVLKQGSKKIKTIKIAKNKTSYKIPKKLFKKGKKYSFTLIAKGTSNYKNSKEAKSKVLKIKK